MRIPHTFTASYILFLRDGKVLLSRRYQTGFEDGNYSLPAGHTEPGETFTTALIREIQEETGVTLTPENVTVSHIMHRHSQYERSYVDVFYTAKNWTGTPENKEPEKCDDLSWFPIDNLPENTLPYVRKAIENSLNNIPYSEFGWDQ
ncbi:MAG: NUDIX domain-containing protein [Candidatus Moraniibacteriota bacterium]